MVTPFWGFFALVTYVPAPLGAVLDDIRQSLPGSHFAQAHITILPPRPLRLPVDAASAYARHVLAPFTSFEVELNEVKVFPETAILYLNLSDGDRMVHDLHDALDSGDLFHREEFEFRPHLTLGGPIPPQSLSQSRREVEEVWASLGDQKRFSVREIVALWATDDGSGLRWERVWSHQLPTSESRGARAGH